MDSIRNLYKDKADTLPSSRSGGEDVIVFCLKMIMQFYFTIRKSALQQKLSRCHKRKIIYQMGFTLVKAFIKKAVIKC